MLTLDLTDFSTLTQCSDHAHIGAVFGPEHMGKTGIRKTTGAGSRTQKTPRGSWEPEVTKGAGKGDKHPKHTTGANPHPWDRVAVWQCTGCSAPCKRGVQTVLQHGGTRGHS